MTTSFKSAEPVLDVAPANLPAWMRRHPLVSFFGMAYALPWLLWIPLLVLSQDGLSVLPFAVPATPVVILGGFGPLIAALIMTGLLEGRPGVRQLLARCLRWRVGLPWYLLLFLIPVAFLLVSVLLGAIGIDVVRQGWPLLFTFYPLDLIIGVIIAGGLGEEPGWRGFALPRLQSAFGPLPAALLLGVIHACWHIPLFFVGGLGQAHFNFLVYLLTGVAISVMMTWVYNNTGGSLLIIMLLHEAQDTTSTLSLRIAPAYLNRIPAYAILYGLIALVALLATQGFLAYKGARGVAPDTRAGSRSTL